MTKKQLVRAVAFMLVLASMFVLLSNLFENGSNRTNSIRVNSYFNLEKDTLDVAFVGTSGFDRYWLTPKAFEEYGIASYVLASNGNPTWYLKSEVKDIERRHENLRLMVIDMRPYGVNYVNQNLERYDSRARSFIDTLPFFSRLRFETINTTLKLIDENVEGASRWDLSYFFPFIKCHTRWSEDNFDIKKELEEPLSQYMGAFIHKSLAIRKMKQPVTTYISDKRMALDPICERDLHDLLDYLETRDYEVLFLNTPHDQNQRETERANTVCDILDSRGFKYVNCELDGNMYDLVNDFYNGDHVNYYGSEKFTKWFAEYLVENYDLPDRRGDDKYYQWVGTYDKVKKTIAAWEKQAESKAAAEAANNTANKTNNTANNTANKTNNTANNTANKTNNTANNTANKVTNNNANNTANKTVNNAA